MKRIFEKIVTSIFLIFFSLTASGQNKSINPLQGFKNPFAAKQSASSSVIMPESSHPSITPNNGSFFINVEKYNLSTHDIPSRIANLLNLNSGHIFRVESEQKDTMGFTHYNLKQYYKNIPINDASVLVHSKNGRIQTINGKVAEFSFLQTQPSISDDQAYKLSLRYLNVKDETTPDYPKELMVYQLENKGKSNYFLTYRVRIDAMSPFAMCYVFVDALNGKVINKVDLLCHADSPGTANTLYSGTQNIISDSYAGGYRLRESGRNIQTFNATNATFSPGTGFSGHTDFTDSDNNWTGVPYLSSFTVSNAAQGWWYAIFADEYPDFYIKVIDGSGQLVYTSAYFNNVFPPNTYYPNLLLQNPPYIVEVWDYDAVGGNDFGGSYAISTNTGTQSWNGNGNSGNYTVSGLNNPALDVHWGMERTYDFYSTVFSRNSFDGNGTLVKNYVNGTIQVSGDPNNAFAYPAPLNIMVYGMGDGTNMGPVVGLDVTGHEFTHLVVNNNGNGGLTYQGESGALNESFADIFGTCIEFYSGVNPDWTIGEGVTISTPYLRSMSNPNSANNPQPDTYEGLHWANPTNLSFDNGGVHINSGVQNFWFYLLSQGGSGTNDLGNSYSVTGIGINQARQIAYRNLTNYLAPSSNFLDAYNGSLQAAQDLYGNPSTQYTAVRNAWYAVGIGNSPSSFCSGETWLDASTGTITDGSGAANYNDNSDCRWVIAPPGATQVTLNFTYFDTEADYDTVFVYDGYDESGGLLMTWWGNTLPPTIISTGGALCVRFTSDITITAGGFSANYTSTGINPTCNGGTVLANPTGSFSDGSGGANYGNNYLCYWLIAPPCANNVTLSFSSFNTEAGYDGVIVFNGNNTSAPVLLNWSGNGVPSNVTANSGQMLVVFVSDYIVTFPGFNASYTSTGSAYCSGQTVLNSSDAGSFTDGSGGNNYCNNMNCSWLIQPPQATSVSLSFSNFDVEPISPDGFTIYDAVEVYDGTNASAPLLGRFTGNAIPPILSSTGGSMFVKFFSDVDVVGQGWNATYTSTTATYCSGSTTLTAPSGTFDDGSGANQYGNNSECSWLIQPANALSISLSFSAFSTELNNDGVVVYDGPDNSSLVLGQFSGTNIPSTVTSTGGSMFVEFLSNQSVRGNGWNASYNSQITGLESVSGNQNLIVMPNPNQGIFSVVLPEDFGKESVLNIYNDMGQLVWSKSLLEENAKDFEINLSKQTAGVYMMNLISDKIYFTHKIIIHN